MLLSLFAFNRTVSGTQRRGLYPIARWNEIFKEQETLGGSAGGSIGSRISREETGQQWETGRTTEEKKRRREGDKRPA